MVLLKQLWELVMDREAWHAAVHGVAKSWAWMSDWTELNGLVVFSPFFNLNLNFAIRSWWSEPQLAPGLVFADCIELHLCQAPNHSDLGIHHLVMSMCRVVSWVGKGGLLWPACSRDKTLLAFALLHFSFQGQTCLFFQVSLDFLLLHSSLLWWKELLFLVLILGSVIGLYRTGNNFSYLASVVEA